MGGWVCLKSLEQLPQIKKGFALSTWNIYGDLKTIPDEKKLIEAANNPDIFQIILFLTRTIWKYSFLHL